MSVVEVSSLAEVDLPAVAALHLRAFPQSALTALGREAVTRYYEWQFSGPHDVVALGAWVDADLAGFCFGGVFRGALSGFLRKNRSYLAVRVLTRPWLIANPIFREKAATATRALSPFIVRCGRSPVPVRAPKSFGILAIAVCPQRQRLGIGSALMNACEVIARERGFDQMHLTVHPENRQAKAFYERLGWERIIQGRSWRGAMRKPVEGPFATDAQRAAIDAASSG
jgi:ribosomal protein S18 acetylase RimI-like enzyme